MKLEKNMLDKIVELQRRYNMSVSVTTNVMDYDFLFSFRKTGAGNMVWTKNYKVTSEEIVQSNVDISDILENLTGQFIKEFNTEQEKYW